MLSPPDQGSDFLVAKREPPTLAVNPLASHVTGDDQPPDADCNEATGQNNRPGNLGSRSLGWAVPLR